MHCDYLGENLSSCEQILHKISIYDYATLKFQNYRNYRSQDKNMCNNVVIISLLNPRGTNTRFIIENRKNSILLLTDKLCLANQSHFSTTTSVKKHPKAWYCLLDYKDWLSLITRGTLVHGRYRWWLVAVVNAGNWIVYSDKINKCWMNDFISTPLHNILTFNIFSNVSYANVVVNAVLLETG